MQPIKVNRPGGSTAWTHCACPVGSCVAPVGRLLALWQNATWVKHPGPPASTITKLWRQENWVQIPPPPLEAGGCGRLLSESPFFLFQRPARVPGSVPSQAAVPSWAGESAGIDQPCLPKAGRECRPCATLSRPSCQPLKRLSLHVNVSNLSHSWRKTVLTTPRMVTRPHSSRGFQRTVFTCASGILQDSERSIPFRMEAQTRPLVQRVRASSKEEFALGILPSFSPKLCQRCQPSS